MRLLHQPPTTARVLVGLIGLAAIAANAALLLSDRAPGMLRSLFGDVVRQISERLDAGGRADAALTARDVGGDSIVHFGLWATAAIIIGLSVWSWLGLVVAGTTIGAISLFIEVGQGRYSSSRAVERSDALFNLLGVGAGVVAVAVVYVLGESLGRLVRKADSRAVTSSA